MARLVRMVGLCAIAFGVAACGGEAQPEKKTEYDGRDGVDLAGLIGISKNPPDEFAVMTTKPLEMPDSFAALPAPTPGARSALAPDPVAEARAALLGEAAPQAANARTSVAESALLSATGTAPTTDIRGVLEAEQAELDANGQVYALEGVFPSLRRQRETADALLPSDERVRLSELSSAPTVGSSGIATIPSTTAAPLPVTPAPVAAVPSPATDATLGGELIYIPE